MASGVRRLSCGARERPRAWYSKLLRGAFCFMVRADSEAAEGERGWRGPRVRNPDNGKRALEIHCPRALATQLVGDVGARPDG
eukprot:7426094-Alexandrium_andersonii.AAC.1